MGVILDTSALIAAERGALRFTDLLESLGDAPIGMAAITASELLHGCHRAGNPGTRARRSAFVDAVLEMIPVFAFGLIEARRHAHLWADLMAEGALEVIPDLVGHVAVGRRPVGQHPKAARILAPQGPPLSPHRDNNSARYYCQT